MTWYPHHSCSADEAHPGRIDVRPLRIIPSVSVRLQWEAHSRWMLIRYKAPPCSSACDAMELATVLFPAPGKPQNTSINVLALSTLTMVLARGLDASKCTPTRAKRAGASQMPQTPSNHAQPFKAGFTRIAKPCRTISTSPQRTNAHCTQQCALDSDQVCR